MNKEFESPFRSAADRWRSAVVARRVISDFTGGAYKPKSMQNEDSLGTGPKGRFLLGKMVVYPLDQLVKWLEERSKPIEERDPAGDSLRKFPKKKR